MQNLTQARAFLNEWLNQLNTKASYIPDEVLVEALKALEEIGIPNLKNESYRHIPIENILKRHFRKIQLARIPENFIIPESILSNHIVLLPTSTFIQCADTGIQSYSNGTGIPEEYSEYIGRISMHQNDFFAALNTAYNENFTVIHIRKSLQNPLHIQHIIPDHSNFSQHRVLIVVEPQVEARILETYDVPKFQNPFFYNTLTEIYVKNQGHIHWINFQNAFESPLYHINNTAFCLEKASVLNHHQISLQASLWRNNIHIHIQDTDISCQLKGLSIGKKQSIISQNTSIQHHTGYSQSHQLYKQIADDKSTVLFNGFIRVDKDAQKTDAFQNSKNVLLSDDATLLAKPHLEIYADDVKCTHGSTTGTLNNDALFYMKTRGIEEPLAQKLLLQAFYSDIIESLRHDTIKNYIESQLHLESIHA